MAAGATTLVVIDFSKLYLKGYLPSNRISQIKLNDPARIFLDAFPGKTFDARITKINQQAEFTPKSVDTPQQRVKLVFGHVELRVTNNGSHLFKPGMPADAVIQDRSEGRLVLAGGPAVRNFGFLILDFGLKRAVQGSQFRVQGWVAWLRTSLSHVFKTAPSRSRLLSEFCTLHFALFILSLSFPRVAP